VFHLEFLVVRGEFHKSLMKRSCNCNLCSVLLHNKLCKSTYVQYSFDQLFMRCQHSEVVHRISFTETVHVSKKVADYRFKPNPVL